VLNINRENRCETAQRHRYSKLFPAQTSLTSFQSTILSSSSSLSLSLSLKRKKKTEQNETNKQTLVSIIAVVVVQNIDERLNCLALQDKGEREREKKRDRADRESHRGDEEDDKLQIPDILISSGLPSLSCGEWGRFVC
jgi:hypothetical protein